MPTIPTNPFAHLNATSTVFPLGEAPNLWHNVVNSFAGTPYAPTLF